MLRAKIFTEVRFRRKRKSLPRAGTVLRGTVKAVGAKQVAAILT